MLSKLCGRHALTMARARLAGSSDLKMPLPTSYGTQRELKAWASRLLPLSIPRNTKNVTKTPSTPSCMPCTCIHSLLLRWSLGGSQRFWCISSFLLQSRCTRQHLRGLPHHPLQSSPPEPNRSVSCFPSWLQESVYGLESRGTQTLSVPQGMESQLRCIMSTSVSVWETGRKLSSLLHLFCAKSPESKTAHLPPTCGLNQNLEFIRDKTAACCRRSIGAPISWQAGLCYETIPLKLCCPWHR